LTARGFYTRYDPCSTFATKKKPGDEPGFAAVRRPAISPTPRQSEPVALSVAKDADQGMEASAATIRDYIRRQNAVALNYQRAIYAEI